MFVYHDKETLFNLLIKTLNANFNSFNLKINMRTEIDGKNIKYLDPREAKRCYTLLPAKFTLSNLWYQIRYDGDSPDPMAHLKAIWLALKHATVSD